MVRHESAGTALGAVLALALQLAVTDVVELYLAHLFFLGGVIASSVCVGCVIVGSFRTGLRVAVGQVDGIKIAGHLTGNPGTGKAAGELFASYPIGKIDDSLGIYIFGQAYTGYGEALDDYDRRDTHARIGISFTR